MEEVKYDFNVFVGSETGILKGINLNNKAVIQKNFNNLKVLDRNKEITSMCWGDADQEELVVGMRDQTMKIFNTKANSFFSSRQIDVGSGPIVSLGKSNGITLTAVQSGEITLWRGEGSVEINAVTKGEFLSCMRVNPWDDKIIATGGKEEELQMWNLENPKQSFFKAKNVPHDMLELRVPVWVSDIAFMTDKTSIAIASRHKHVRLYDPARQRRPIVTFEWGDSPLTSISSVPHYNNQVVVGTAHGCMALFDLRGGKPDVPVSIYKVFSGAVKDILVHPIEPLVFSVSLDRYLRVHHLLTRKLLCKEYLKSRLNCMLVRSDCQLNDILPQVSKPIRRKRKCVKVTEASDPDQDKEWSSLTKISDRATLKRLQLREKLEGRKKLKASLDSQNTDILDSL